MIGFFRLAREYVRLIQPRCRCAPWVARSVDDNAVPACQVCDLDYLGIPSVGRFQYIDFRRRVSRCQSSECTPGLFSRFGIFFRLAAAYRVRRCTAFTPPVQGLPGCMLAYACPVPGSTCGILFSVTVHLLTTRHEAWISATLEPVPCSGSRATLAHSQPSGSHSLFSEVTRGGSSHHLPSCKPGRSTLNYRIMSVAGTKPHHGGIRDRG